MSSQRCNFTVGTFTPEGKIGQVEYANKCASKGAPSVAIIATNGIVFATSKKIESVLALGDSVQKINKLDDYIGMVYSGYGPDYRILVTRAMKEKTAHSINIKKDISVIRMVKSIGTVMQEYTQALGVRPFGVNLLVGGLDTYKIDAGSKIGRPALYQCDAGGEFKSVNAAALGIGAKQMTKFLENHYVKSIMLDAAVCLAIRTIMVGNESSLPALHLNVSICNMDGFQTLRTAEIENFMKMPFFKQLK